VSERDYDIVRATTYFGMNTDYRIQTIAKIAGIAKNLVIDLSGGSSLIRDDPR